MGKNIGIITLHYSDNYGSVLQAYALQTYFEKKADLNAWIIDYIQSYDAMNYKLFRTEIYRHRPQAFLADVIFAGKNRKRKANFEKFRKQYLHMTEEKYDSLEQLKNLNRKMTAFVCGSDQIWNFDCTNGIDKAYFLAFADQSKKKIAYAPSFGQASFEIDEMKKIRPYLKDFDLISVREKSMKGRLEKEIGKPVKCVVDPTLLLGREYYDQLCEGQKKADKYVFVYMLEENLALLNDAKKYAEKNKLDIIYISNISKKGQVILKKYTNAYGATPGEFLEYIKNAECVITNSFHATVFSILYEKKFCTYKTKYSFPRMLDLLENLGLSSRIFDENFEMGSRIDYKAVQAKLDQMREKSVAYLQDAIDLINEDGKTEVN